MNQDKRGSVLQCVGTDFILTADERLNLYNKFSRKIDRVGFDYLSSNRHHRAVTIANSKLLIHILIQHTDKSLSIWIGISDLLKLTDLSKKAINQCIKFLCEVGLLIKHRGGTFILIPPKTDEVTILEVYNKFIESQHPSI